MNEHSTTTLNAGLYIVPTPIGNLQDITYRAIDTLKRVSLIAAEDTRHTRHLLQQFNIHTPLSSFHAHNEQDKADYFLDKIITGQAIALVSDAGTPLINDPGYPLVLRCREQGIPVIPLPGACAVITALSASGLPTDRFCFEGFLPAKQHARVQKLQQLTQETRTIIVYESKHRLLDSIRDIINTMGGNRYLVLARELTKSWETIYGNQASLLLRWLEEDENRTKGEMVLVIEGAAATKQALSSEAIRTLALLQEELPLKKACHLVAKIHQIDKKELYNYAILQKKER